MMNEVVLKTNGLCKSYAGRLALDHVDMEVRKGSIYGFIGKNGAGKTTLMRVVGGLASPTDGSFELMGASTPREIEKARSRMGSIIETPSLYPNLTAYENMEVQRRILGATGRNLIQDTLELIGLNKVGKKKVKAFSLGMKQRLGLAIALLGRPDFLLLDEPINGLDPYGIAETREALKRLATQNHITILISSHILSELHLLATHYGFIDDGRLLEQISAEELMEKCREYIRLVVSDTEKCVAVLEDKLGVKRFTVLPGNVVHVFDFVDSSEQVNAALYAGGVGIKSSGVMGQDLESYFINLTGGGKHE